MHVGCIWYVDLHYIDNIVYTFFLPSLSPYTADDGNGTTDDKSYECNSSDNNNQNNNNVSDSLIDTASLSTIVNMIHNDTDDGNNNNNNSRSVDIGIKLQSEMCFDNHNEMMQHITDYSNHIGFKPVIRRTNVLPSGIKKDGQIRYGICKWWHI